MVERQVNHPAFRGLLSLSPFTFTHSSHSFLHPRRPSSGALSCTPPTGLRRTLVRLYIPFDLFLDVVLVFKPVTAHPAPWTCYTLGQRGRAHLKTSMWISAVCLLARPVNKDESEKIFLLNGTSSGSGLSAGRMGSCKAGKKSRTAGVVRFYLFFCPKSPTGGIGPHSPRLSSPLVVLSLPFWSWDHIIGTLVSL